MPACTATANGSYQSERGRPWLEPHQPLTREGHRRQVGAPPGTGCEAYVAPRRPTASAPTPAVRCSSSPPCGTQDKAGQSVSESNPSSTGSASRITRLLDALDQLVFRDPDRRAKARGWQIRTSRRYTRVYRDPRFDDLPPPCGTCGGGGRAGSSECTDCGTSGRTGSCPNRRQV